MSKKNEKTLDKEKKKLIKNEKNASKKNKKVLKKEKANLKKEEKKTEKKNDKLIKKQKRASRNDSELLNSYSKEELSNSFTKALSEKHFLTHKSKVRFIKKYRKYLINQKKKIFKGEIKRSANPIEKKELRKKYKNSLIYGKTQNSKDNIIDLININKLYTSKETYEHVLRDINLVIKKGEIVIILGASGSGKTTLLNVLSGLTDATSGDVIVNNTNLFYLSESKKTKFRADNLSFVFQSYNLIPTLTVSENVKVGYNLRRQNKEGKNVKEILKILGIEKQANKYPFQLSGGQNQRVSIGRALAKNPEILFADEPTGALDEFHGKEALKLLLEINKKYGTTLIIVTHNPNFSVVADRVIRVVDGEVLKIDRHGSKTTNVDSIKWV
ncbi:MAG: hypothetical protein HPAVJP_0180 [Candidatus Hepatoplasma vulgare]|nr:MAG: hypothetical protein HPAVJP_0180 [Candidatus Hepatoplasma sp.]